MNLRHFVFIIVASFVRLSCGYAVDTMDSVKFNQAAIGNNSTQNFQSNQKQQFLEENKATDNSVPLKKTHLVCYKSLGDFLEIKSMIFLLGIIFSLIFSFIISALSIGIYRKNLIKRYRQGDSESTVLLAEEARGLIDDQRKIISNSYENIKDINVKIDSIVENQLNQTSNIVENFKQKLNSFSDQILQYLGGVADSSKSAQSDVAQCRDVLLQTAHLLDKKEKEITVLKEGFQKSLLQPILLSFIETRDDFHKEMGECTDDGVSAMLKKGVEKIDISLKKTGIMRMEIPENPDDLPLHYWDTLEAAKLTNDPNLAGKKVALFVMDISLALLISTGIS